jgi:hypothetical protein
MCLETGQLLSTAWRMVDGDEFADKRGLYKCTHKNHPSALWARETDLNYIWLYQLFLELGKEYTYRYGKEHLTIKKLKRPLDMAPRGIKQGFMTEMPQCMPDDAKRPDPVDGYRNYYRVHKAHLLNYTKRPEPEWLVAESLEDPYRHYY